MRTAHALVATLCCLASPLTVDAKGYGHHYTHHYSHGRYHHRMRRTYRSSYGRSYYHGATQYWVTVLGVRYLYGERTFNDCGEGQTCEAAPACCHQEMAATVVTATADVRLDPHQQLPAFSPAYVPSDLSAEVSRDVRSALAASGVAVAEHMIVFAMLAPRTLTLRVLVPANVNAATVALVLGAGATNGTRGTWKDLAAPQYALAGGGPPTTSRATLEITADESAMNARLCAVGVQQRAAVAVAGAGCDLPDPCASAPCAHGGVCFSGVGAFACDCQPGWSGALCDEAVDECTEAERDEAACGAGAICERLGGAGDAECRCPYGRILVDGSGCVDRDECGLSPCEHGGACIESSSDLAAWTDEDGKVTTVALGEFLCVCGGGWQGPRCDEREPPLSGVIIVGGVLLGVCIVCACSNQVAEYQGNQVRYAKLAEKNAPKAAGGSMGARGGRSATWSGSPGAARGGMHQQARRPITTRTSAGGGGGGPVAFSFRA